MAREYLVSTAADKNIVFEKRYCLLLAGVGVGLSEVVKLAQTHQSPNV